MGEPLGKIVSIGRTAYIYEYTNETVVKLLSHSFQIVLPIKNQVSILLFKDGSYAMETSILITY